MILQQYKTINSLFAYQFHFGLEAYSKVAFENFCTTCPFQNLTLGCYNTVFDKINQCKVQNIDKVRDPALQPKIDYIPAYQKNVGRRIRPLYRVLRDSMVIESKPIPLTGIQFHSGSLVSPTKPACIRFLIVLQKIGVGSITLWIEDLNPTNEEQWYILRDPCLVTVKLEQQALPQNVWTLIAFIRYLILLSHLGLSKQKMSRLADEIARATESDIALDHFLGKHLSRRYRKRILTSVQVESYPIFFLQYHMTTEELRKAVLDKPEDIRLILCGDRNWRWKTSEIVKQSVLNADTSYRKSIFWLVNSEGSVKLCSSGLETSVKESFTATVLETDIILTMRYFLQRINGLMLKLGKSRLSPNELSSLRHRLFMDLDKYCNIEVSHKDTTRRRVEKLKGIFAIDSMYNGVVDRFDLLSGRLASRHAYELHIQQVLLTLVFGFFGSLTALYRILTNVKSLPADGILSALGLSLLGSSTITAGLYLLIRLIWKMTEHRG
jgi:hypothetical protein